MRRRRSSPTSTSTSLAARPTADPGARRTAGPTAYGWSGLMAASGTAAADKRRVILDAAMRVFARQGFHTCRVSDIADEAGVAYGLVYHYFSSKEEILDTLFLERWDVMLAAIAEADRIPALAARQAAGDRRVHRRLLPPRAGADEGDHRRGHAGREHVRPHPSGQDPRGVRADRGDRRARPGRRRVPAARSRQTSAALAFYGSIEQVLTAGSSTATPSTTTSSRAPRR